MQEPSLSTLVFSAMSDSETASIPHTSLETNNARDSAQPSVPSLDTSLSNAETLRLFSQLLNVKFNQKFAAFTRDLEDKEAATQSQLKKLKTESKASNSFTFKGNKVRYELNISLHNLVDGAVKNISKGNLSAAISKLESKAAYTDFPKAQNETSLFALLIGVLQAGQPLRSTSWMLGKYDCN